jgi:hypothetical protein
MCSSIFPEYSLARFGEDLKVRKCKKYLILLVGAAGFEPTTPSPPDWCANRAAPRPDRNGANDRTVRAVELATELARMLQPCRVQAAGTQLRLSPCRRDDILE